MESIECKIQVLDMEIQAIRRENGEPVDMTEPAQKIIRERWKSLKQFSIYTLYQGYNQNKGDDNIQTDAELLVWLARQSDQKMDQFINMDQDDIISRDVLINRLCYDLLRDYAELKKMCNKYQLTVLLNKQLMHGKPPVSARGHPELSS